MRVLSFTADPNREECLKAVDALREDLVLGRVIAFSAVAIAPNDEVLSYIGSSRPVTRLRMQGAIGQLFFSFFGDSCG